MWIHTIINQVMCRMPKIYSVKITNTIFVNNTTRTYQSPVQITKKAKKNLIIHDEGKYKRKYKEIKFDDLICFAPIQKT